MALIRRVSRSSLISRRVAGIVATVAASATVLLSVTVPSATADTRPPTGTPATASTDVLPAPQINGVVWTQLIVGNTVYVGGDFTSARPFGAAAGTQETPRANFLAFDITTGALLTAGTIPAFNSKVRALAVSPDQKTLYVGGQFDSVTTTSAQSRYRIAAFTIGTGTLSLTSFRPIVNASVYGLAATETKLYAVGSFSTVTSTTRQNAVALDRTTGAVQPFKVTPAGGSIRQIVVSPDRNKVAIGGSFTSLNGSSNPGYGLAMVDANTGASLAMPLNSVVRDAGADSGIMSLTTSGDGYFYGSGYVYGGTTRNLEGSFKADWSGRLVWLEDCHGDTYSTAPTANVVYVAGHPHDCARVGGFPDTSNPVEYHHGLAFTTAVTRTLSRNQVSGYKDFGGQPAPTLLHFFPDFAVGTFTGQSQAAWSVVANADYVVYGGEFPRINGKAQQGLVRFAVTTKAPNLDGPRLAGADMGFTARSSLFSGPRLQLPADYDRDNTALTYVFYRNGAVLSQTTVNSNFWTRPTVSYTDSTASRGTTYTYKVVVKDPLGNTKTSSEVSVRA